jgi:hypothetical protein
MAAQTSAQQFLEQWQRIIYGKLGQLEDHDNTLPHPDRERKAIAIIEEQIAARAAILPPEEVEKWRQALYRQHEAVNSYELPSRYQQANDYLLLVSLKSQIEQAVGDLNWKLPLSPQVGTLPTGSVNAAACPVPNSDELLVVFEDQLFTFVLLLSKVLLRSLPFEGNRDGNLHFSTDEAAWKRNLSENPMILRRFQEVLYAYLLAGKPGSAPRYTLEEPYNTIAGELITSTELFIMGHEYGHIIAGHVAHGRSSSALPDPAEVPSPAADPAESAQMESWAREFEADSLGLQLMLFAMKRRGITNLRLAYWGADVFLSCLQVVEHGLTIMRQGNEDHIELESDHPPVLFRREMLRGVLRAHAPAEMAEGAVKLAATVEQIINELWAQTRGHLLGLRARGETLDARWSLPAP